MGSLGGVSNTEMLAGLTWMQPGQLILGSLPKGFPRLNLHHLRPGANDSSCPAIACRSRLHPQVPRFTWCAGYDSRSAYVRAK